MRLGTLKPDMNDDYHALAHALATKFILLDTVSSPQGSPADLPVSVMSLGVSIDVTYKWNSCSFYTWRLIIHDPSVPDKS